MLHLHFSKLDLFNFIIVIMILIAKLLRLQLLLIEDLSKVITVVIIISFIASILLLEAIIPSNTVVLPLSMVLSLLFFNEYTHLIVIYLLHQSPSQVLIHFLVLQDFIILINTVKQTHKLILIKNY